MGSPESRRGVELRCIEDSRSAPFRRRATGAFYLKAEVHREQRMPSAKIDFVPEQTRLLLIDVGRRLLELHFTADVKGVPNRSTDTSEDHRTDRRAVGHIGSAE